MDATLCTYHPLLLELAHRLEVLGVGTVMQTPDGHLFFSPRKGIDELRGAVDLKKEGAEAGVRIVIRKVNKRSKYCKYANMPWFQFYALPIPVKNAATMTDAERLNSELYRQALRMAHAVMRDPVQCAIWQEKHAAHRADHRGYSKLYPNFFGFLVATFRMQLAAQLSAQPAAEERPVDEASGNAAINLATPSITPASPSITPAFYAGITLCVPLFSRTSSSARSVRCASPPPRARSIPLYARPHPAAA